MVDRNSLLLAFFGDFLFVSLFAKNAYYYAKFFFSEIFHLKTSSTFFVRKTTY